ncbi:MULTISPECIES: helix-turn-helix domain-containing protein [Pseudomonadota]|jgi:excisionase family DNA binding protein|uniref:helix-turn-helix domain-containing protein n=1 Tax=Pseudomonadota TaxID=1224 RepID=UPI000769CE25|nr:MULTISPECIES: helix-turn-helix domain-containing protein [Sphingomonadaceae]
MHCTSTPQIAYSITEACRLTSLGRSTIYSCLAQGALQARKVGRRRLILAESLHALIMPQNDDGDERTPLRDEVNAPAIGA